MYVGGVLRSIALDAIKKISLSQQFPNSYTRNQIGNFKQLEICLLASDVSKYLIWFRGEFRVPSVITRMSFPDLDFKRFFSWAWIKSLCFTILWPHVNKTKKYTETQLSFFVLNNMTSPLKPRIFGTLVKHPQNENVKY